MQIKKVRSRSYAQKTLLQLSPNITKHIAHRTKHVNKEHAFLSRDKKTHLVYALKHNLYLVIFGKFILAFFIIYVNKKRT